MASGNPRVIAYWRWFTYNRTFYMYHFWGSFLEKVSLLPARTATPGNPSKQ